MEYEIGRILGGLNGPEGSDEMSKQKYIVCEGKDTLVFYAGELDEHGNPEHLRLLQLIADLEESEINAKWEAQYSRTYSLATRLANRKVTSNCYKEKKEAIEKRGEVIGGGRVGLLEGKLILHGASRMFGPVPHKKLDAMKETILEGYKSLFPEVETIEIMEGE